MLTVPPLFFLSLSFYFYEALSGLVSLFLLCPPVSLSASLVPVIGTVYVGEKYYSTVHIHNKKNEKTFSLLGKVSAFSVRKLASHRPLCHSSRQVMIHPLSLCSFKAEWDFFGGGSG